MSGDRRAVPGEKGAYRAKRWARRRSWPSKQPAPTPSWEPSRDAVGPSHSPGDGADPPDRLQDFALRLSLTQEHERRRIAIGLHDQVGQALAVLKGQLDNLQTCVESPQITRSIAEMRALVTETIQATRALTFDLASPVLHQLGLEAALRGLGEQLQRQAGVRFRFLAGKPGQTTTEATNIIVYRCVRELLRNVADHADARHVTMRITASNGQLTAAVEDDGVGFEPLGIESSFGPSGHFGLYSIAEQLRLIGGRLEVESTPGSGTRVLVIVPLTPLKHSTIGPCRPGNVAVPPGSATARGGSP